MVTGKKSKGKMVIDHQRCKGCGLCIWVCPKGSIMPSDQVDNRGIRVACLKDQHHCIGCSFCGIICPDVAISVYKEYFSKA